MVLGHVALDANVYADDARACRTLDSFYSVSRVNHSAKEFVRGIAHTNGIESLWAIVKRCYMGTHHWWSRKHTQRYLDTSCFRRNMSMGQSAVVSKLLGLGLDAR